MFLLLLYSLRVSTERKVHNSGICAQGYSVVCYNVHKLLLKIKMARLEATIFEFFESLS